MTAWLLWAALQESTVPAARTVTLREADATIGEALAAIAEQTGIEIGAPAATAERAFAAEWTDTPLLQALDELCRAAGAGRVRIVHARNEEGEDSIDVDWSADRPLRTAHGRHFSAEILDVTVVTTRSLREMERTASLTIHLDAEPGVRPLRVGTFVIEEALDDAGWSLDASSPEMNIRGEAAVAGEDPNFVSMGDTVGSRRGGWGPRAVGLRAPAPEAARLKTLRGHMLVSFPMRRVEDTIPVADLTPGREIAVGAMSIKMVSVEQKESAFTIVCEVRHAGGERNFPSFQLLDKDGNSVGSSRSGRGNGRTYTMQYRLTGPNPVDAVHYEAWVGLTTIEVPFEFRDVPLKPEDF